MLRNIFCLNEIQRNGKKDDFRHCKTGDLKHYDLPDISIYSMW